MSELTPRDAAWWSDEEAPRAGRGGRQALWLAVLVLLIGVGLFVGLVHLTPSLGAAADAVGVDRATPTLREGVRAPQHGGGLRRVCGSGRRSFSRVER